VRNVVAAVCSVSSSSSSSTLPPCRAFHESSEESDYVPSSSDDDDEDEAEVRCVDQNQVDDPTIVYCGGNAPDFDEAELWDDSEDDYLLDWDAIHTLPISELSGRSLYARQEMERRTEELKVLGLPVNETTREILELLNLCDSHNITDQGLQSLSSLTNLQTLGGQEISIRVLLTTDSCFVLSRATQVLDPLTLPTATLPLFYKCLI
jgi:hypothetical protein